MFNLNQQQQKSLIKLRAKLQLILWLIYVPEKIKNLYFVKIYINNCRKNANFAINPATNDKQNFIVPKHQIGRENLVRNCGRFCFFKFSSIKPLLSQEIAFFIWFLATRSERLFPWQTTDIKWLFWVKIASMLFGSQPSSFWVHRIWNISGFFKLRLWCMKTF